MAVAAEEHIPIPTRLGQRLSAPEREAMCRRQFPCATIDAARLGDIAEREILLDGQRVDVAPEGGVGGDHLEL